MASKRAAARSKYLRTRSFELMTEDLRQGGEGEIAHQPPQARLGGAEVQVVRGARAPGERNARVIGVELPGMQVEDHRPARGLRALEVGARDRVGVDAEVRA